MSKELVTICPHCKWEQLSKPEYKFCERCGLQIDESFQTHVIEWPNHCLSCGKPALHEDSKYCVYCGYLTATGLENKF